MTENAKPLLRVVRGNPDDAELAALTAVVAAAATHAPPSKPPRRSWWGDKATLARQPLQHGEGAWRASALPR